MSIILHYIYHGMAQAQVISITTQNTLDEVTPPSSNIVTRLYRQSLHLYTMHPKKTHHGNGI